ncbi:hypothetical protein PMAN_b0564 [Pseudoalteromonas marina]|uniref:hypothetical protein n=1 Tax=Pseudoalteromonas marina TaxID=267375 RepID=UPI00026CE9CE|nr:hypothetical protein [Pseudoalteromonas marina]KAF7772923.1 hypothetical protein PMAN_b0564 [Pseudoalteromonas marina]
MGGALVLILVIQLLLLAYSMFIAGGKGAFYKVQSGFILTVSLLLTIAIIFTYPSSYVFYLIQLVVFAITALILYKYYGVKNTEQGFSSRT